MERSDSVVECLTGDWRAAIRASPGSLGCGPLARHIYPSLVLVQPRKTCPYISERLWMGGKESKQTNKIFSAHFSIPNIKTDRMCDSGYLFLTLDGNSITLCIQETPKWVLLQTVKTQMKCSIMLHFIRVYTVSTGKILDMLCMFAYNVLVIV